MNIAKRHNLKSLKRKDEISAVFEGGKKFYFKFGLIIFFQNGKDVHTRVAILVQKKCGKAVRRNYIKRITRNLILDHLQKVVRYNRIVFLYNNSLPFTYSDLEKEFLKIVNNEKNLSFFN